MDNRVMDQFLLIGRINNALSRAQSLEEALKEAINLIVKQGLCDYAVAWFADSAEENVLRPCYWIGPKDLTAKTEGVEDSIIGRVYATGERYMSLQYSEERNPEIDSLFEELEIGSVLCVPLSTKTDTLGCLLFAQSAPASEEDEETLSVLSLLMAVQLDSNPDICRPVDFSERKVIISAKNVCREFLNGEVVTKVLKGVNLDVYEGEFVALLGESGCGKSTFLNIIGGMDSADSGALTFLDRDLSHASQKELTEYRRDNIGYIFQSYNLMPNLTARQNLDLIAELVDHPMSSDEALDLVELGDRKSSYPSQLSGGQQQRVSIARALVKRPKMILADEPTAALDYATSIQVLKVIEKVAKAGTTIVMVTHNEEICRMADRVVRFRDGKTYEVTVNRHPVHAEELVW